MESAVGHHGVPGPCLRCLQRRQQAEAERGYGAGVGPARSLPGRAQHGGGPGGEAAPLAGHPGGPAERAVGRAHLTQVCQRCSVTR
jgi:hypothetical protein